MIGSPRPCVPVLELAEELLEVDLKGRELLRRWACGRWRSSNPELLKHSLDIIALAPFLGGLAPKQLANRRGADLPFAAF